MRRPAAAVFAMPEASHFQRLRPLVADLARAGIEPHVFTDRRFRPEVERAGGRFVDLFAAHPLEAVDRESVPVPCRYVSFAGAYADQIAGEVEKLRPSLVVYDTFAVIGHVVARLLGIPYVNVCAGHNVDPARFVERLEDDPRVSIAPSCHRAVETLRERYGVADASPFSYLSGHSPFLNLYCEPAAYLTEEERKPFEPIAFYGSLPSIDQIKARSGDGDRSWFGGDPAELKVYVSFGTVVWRYWPSEALDALGSIAGALGSMPDARGLISLGGAEVGSEAERALARANVAVKEYVDQWLVLGEADAFITHQGLNSTHEATFNRVPMISYPFFADQPALAERCRRLGLAIPLAGSPRGRLSESDVEGALTELAARSESMRAALDRGHRWERETIESRGSILERVTELAGA
jgi:UDP:flavonoid glycosyltransferase YjiC (YdhE family)